MLSALAVAAAAATLAAWDGAGGSSFSGAPRPAMSYVRSRPACPLGGAARRLAGGAAVEMLSRRRRAPHANLVVASRRPWVALTFDDGPSPAITLSVLRILARERVHATFFVIGAFAARYPGVLRREWAAGDDIANHTLDHLHLTDERGAPRISRAGIRREIRGGRDAICRAGVPAPTLFRPPYGRGLFTPAIRIAASRAGELTVGWDLALDRYLLSRHTVAEDVSALVADVHPGTIILAHDGEVGGATHRGTLRALPLLLAQLRARGLQVVSLRRLLG